MMPRLVTLLCLIVPAHAAATPPAPVDERGFPTPPSDDPKQYRAWRNRLPKAMQNRIATHCREAGGDYQQICNGIGPLAIPAPPSLDPDERAEWLSSLGAPQRHYIAEYCHDANHGFSQLCGGTPVVLTFGSERVQLSAGTKTNGPTVQTPWLARDLDGDGVITADELYSSAAGKLARPGFAALAALDANRDGQLDAADPLFDSLLVWSGKDGTPDERSPGTKILESLSLGVERLERLH